jgi:hypothetical protein
MRPAAKMQKWTRDTVVVETLRRVAGGALGIACLLAPVTVKAQTTFTVSGTVSVSGSGLSGATMTATNGVTCTTSNPQYTCTVPAGWSGTVTPSRGGVSFTPASRDYSNVTANQTAQDYPGTSTTTLSETPANPYVHSTITATWSGTPGPSTGNWLGLYNPGAPSTSFYLYGSISANGVASGSVAYTLPDAARPGTYELRLFSGNVVLAISNSFTVIALPTVSGTVSVSGSPLSGATMTATNGVTCTTSNPQYTCTVPAGWSGTVTPSRGGVSFTPASRDYSDHRDLERHPRPLDRQLAGALQPRGPQYRLLSLWFDRR